MSIARWGMGVAAALFLVGSAVRADDVTSMKSELADLKAKVAAMESAQMAPAAGGDAESLTSMKKKGAIKLGGHVEVAVIVADRDDQESNRFPNQGSEDTVQSTTFSTTEANLDLQVSASKDTFLFMRLDLDDFWNATADQDDLLEEVYFMWKNVRGSAFDLWFGKKAAPFAMNKDPLVLEMITNTNDNKMSSFLGQVWEAADSSAATNNPHVAVGDYAHPGAFNNVFQLGASWKYKDLVKLEGAVFQSRAYTNGTALSTGAGRMTRGMFEDRSDDTLFAQSFVGRLTVTPIEGLELSLSALNEHCESAGDNDLMRGLVTSATNVATFGTDARQGADANSDRQAVSLGADYKFKPIPLELWTEYLHGWDWAWNDRYDTDSVTIGAKYGLTEALDLFLIGDWLGIEDGRVWNRDQEEDYYRLATAIQYTFDNGIILSLEYAHEWYDLEEEDGQVAGRYRVEGAEADVLIFGTIWKF